MSLDPSPSMVIQIDAQALLSSEVDPIRSDVVTRSIMNPESKNQSRFCFIILLAEPNVGTKMNTPAHLAENIFDHKNGSKAPHTLNFLNSHQVTARFWVSFCYNGFTGFLEQFHTRHAIKPIFKGFERPSQIARVIPVPSNFKINCINRQIVAPGFAVQSICKKYDE
ncbi:MAG: hypothetical protein V2J07_00800 [Anaerolineae bacterium]|jgi:hypothetical protein|nr:hypothetical protein [Anaerolineae bacterium]